MRCHLKRVTRKLGQTREELPNHDSVDTTLKYCKLTKRFLLFSDEAMADIYAYNEITVAPIIDKTQAEVEFDDFMKILMLLSINLRNVIISQLG